MVWNILFWVGAALSVLGTTLVMREHTWLKAATVTEGTVVQLIATRGSKGGTSYKPRVTFRDKQGQEHEFTRSWSSQPAGFFVGERIKVAYDPRTNEGRILSFGHRFGLSAAFLAAGLAIAVLSGIFIVGRHLVPRLYLP
ncbi:MAG: hypothetical protein RJA22_102 [Verrucomicrobiota bacterium]|jgi:hypothetical protein